jgi:hypothetical protein
VYLSIFLSYFKVLLSFITLDGKLLTILMPAQCPIFCKHERSYFIPVLTVCTAEFPTKKPGINCKGGWVYICRYKDIYFTHGKNLKYVFWPTKVLLHPLMIFTSSMGIYASMWCYSSQNVTYVSASDTQSPHSNHPCSQCDRYSRKLDCFTQFHFFIFLKSITFLHKTSSSRFPSF